MVDSFNSVFWRNGRISQKYHRKPILLRARITSCDLNPPRLIDSSSGASESIRKRECYCSRCNNQPTNDGNVTNSSTKFSAARDEQTNDEIFSNNRTIVSNVLRRIKRRYRLKSLRRLKSLNEISAMKHRQLSTMSFLFLWKNSWRFRQMKK